MNNIKILDCTLRDGGYCNQWKFGFENEKKIISGLVAANIDIIECGLLVKESYQRGFSKFSAIGQVQEILPIDREGKMYICLMNYGDFDVDKLPICDGDTIHGIRVAFHKKDMLVALSVCEKIKKKGYKVFVQPMVSSRYTDEEFLRLIRIVNDIEPFAFYLVDSFGMMKKKDMLRLFYIIENNLKNAILIGFHSHNNLQLAYANAQTLAELRTQRTIIIDTSIMGMGRGAGNLNTELFIEYLNDNFHGQYKVKPILKIIDEVINNFYRKKYWGYSLPNYLSASHNAHPNYALFLADKNTLTIKNMDEIFSAIEEDKKNIYDKRYIENLYFEYMQRECGADEGLETFMHEINGKKVLLIAPGKSSEDEYEKIVGFASDSNVLSISINFDYSHYNTDYIFLSNLRRFHELNMKKGRKMIVTSNIHTSDVFLRVDYAELLNELDSIKDNAAMMLIKFLMKLGQKEIYLAGLDGYSHDVDANYAEEHLQLATSNDMLDAMNDGMNCMLKKFSEECKISFITSCKYIRV